jgi:hypothetical protein
MEPVHIASAIKTTTEMAISVALPTTVLQQTTVKTEHSALHKKTGTNAFAS